MHARGLRLRGAARRLAITPPSVWPSALLNDAGTPIAIISQRNTLPAGAPVNAAMVALRLAMHDSGSGWIATPFLCDSCIHDSTPVYPGALSTLLGAWRQKNADRIARCVHPDVSFKGPMSESRGRDAFIDGARRMFLWFAKRPSARRQR